jgi:hypothetical protein
MALMLGWTIGTALTAVAWWAAGVEWWPLLVDLLVLSSAIASTLVDDFRRLGTLTGSWPVAVCTVFMLFTNALLVLAGWGLTALGLFG